MQLNLERPDYAFFLRGADGRSALVNDRDPATAVSSSRPTR